MSEAPIDVSFIPDPEFFAIRKELETLPLRKQAKWKGRVQDPDGVNHCVYYRNGEFCFKALSKWIVVRPQSEIELGEIVGYHSLRVEECSRRLDMAYEQGGYLAAATEHERMIKESATGNHHTKPPKIRVPTRAGEPVRA